MPIDSTEEEKHDENLQLLLNLDKPLTSNCLTDFTHTCVSTYLPTYLPTPTYLHLPTYLHHSGSLVSVKTLLYVVSACSLWEARPELEMCVGQ